jgi:hypothetical protein
MEKIHGIQEMKIQANELNAIDGGGYMERNMGVGKDKIGKEMSKGRSRNKEELHREGD